MAAAEHAQRKPESRGRFALAGAGMDDEQALLDRLSGDFGVLHRLALRHLGAMPFGFGVVDRLRHGVTLQRPFIASGRPATTSTTRSARAAMRWLRTPCSRETAGRADNPARCRSRLRWRPAPTGAVAAASACFEPRDFRLDIRVRQHQIRQPQRQAIDQHRRGLARFERGGEIARRLDGPPMRPAPRAMRGDALGHFRVARLRRRHIGPRRRQRGDQALGIAALARTGAAEDESEFCTLDIA